MAYGIDSSKYNFVDTQLIQKFDSVHSNWLWKMNIQMLHAFLY